MKAIRFHRYGGPEVLRLGEMAEPQPGPDEIRIRVVAAGVNGLEAKIRQGVLHEHFPIELPAGTGGDAAGIVDAVGDRVTDVQHGDAVFGSGSDTYAESAVLASWAPKPANVTFEEAAGYPIPLETATRLLDAVHLSPGQWLLISGASGGVGAAAVQLAVARGLKVIGTASSANQNYVRSLGATATVYGDGLSGRVRTITPDAVDAALDVAGSGIIPELVSLTGDPSQVVSIADFSAPRYGARVSTGYGQDKTAALRAGAQLAHDGRFTLPVAGLYPLAQASVAQEAVLSSHAPGRIVITLDDVD